MCSTLKNGYGKKDGGESFNLEGYMRCHVCFLVWTDEWCGGRVNNEFGLLCDTVVRLREGALLWT